MREKLLKYLSFGCVAAIVPLLAAATVLEKLCGSGFAHRHIYAAVPMLLLWGAAGFFSLLYLLKRRTYRRPATFCLHMSFLLILVGALTTHLTGKEGRLHLRTGESAAKIFTLNDGTTAELPFTVALDDFTLEYYAGTFAPSDFVSTVTFDSGDESRTVAISMNNIGTCHGYRFYQSGYDADGRGTILAVSHDPAGIAVTYTGYMWLLLSMLGFFFERNSGFRRLLRHPSLKRGAAMAALLLLTVGGAAAAEMPRTLPRESAEALGDLRIYYNDRICPLQTLAKEFTVKLCGKSSYRGMTAEQVLAGWIFYYDDWKHEPMLKIKGAATRRTLCIDGSYASLTDFTSRRGYKLDEALRNADNDAERRNAAAANEKFNLVSMLCTGSLLRIYPVTDPATGMTTWYSPSDKPAEDIPFEQWLFVRNAMGLAAERVAMRDFAGVDEIMAKIAKYQLNEGGEMPSPLRLQAEKFYNRSNVDKPLAMALLTLGIICFVIFCTTTAAPRLRRPINALLAAVLVYLTAQIALRWFVSRHIPLANGFETMQFMAWCSVALTLALQRRFGMIQPFGLLVCGAALLVAMMGEASPRITNLMPVLQSPLLSIHVMVIMAAYTLLAFTLLNGLTAAVLHILKHDGDGRQAEYLQTVSRLILYPAVFLLTAGIFVGAVWANVSWGRYWGWDPKEVWALITLLVYSATLHADSLPWLRKPMHFHIFCIAAFLTVLITYFGVNFILGGMHGYA